MPIILKKLSKEDFLFKELDEIQALLLAGVSLSERQRALTAKWIRFSVPLLLTKPGAPSTEARDKDIALEYRLLRRLDIPAKRAFARVSKEWSVSEAIVKSAARRYKTPAADYVGEIERIAERIAERNAVSIRDVVNEALSIFSTRNRRATNSKMEFSIMLKKEDFTEGAWKRLHRKG